MKKKTPIPENSTYLLSNRNLFNELLAYVLEKESVSQCSIINDISSLLEIKPGDSNTPLLLIDSSFQDYEKVLASTAAKYQIDVSTFTIGLYNLPYNMGIEKRALLLGIQGFFYKQDNLKLLLKGIKSLFAGEIWIHRNILVEAALEGEQRKIPSVQAKSGLSQREMEILALVSMGAKNDDIAAKLYISPHTVKTHLYHIFKKINVPNRLQAALWAAKNL